MPTYGSDVSFSTSPETTGGSYFSPLWRFVVTDLGGATITMMDHLASERTVTPKLNEPLEVSGTVPSDSPEINIPHTDGFPFLAEGVRQLYCFRRESSVVPYYTIRASTLILQIADSAAADDGRSRFTAWDPWQYLYSLPVLQSSLAGGVDGDLIGSAGLLYPQSLRADEIVIDMLTTTRNAMDITAPAAAQAMFLDIASGTIDACATFPSPGYPAIQQGTSLGQALQDMCSTGYMDIVLTPIYDPGRPGILCELNVLKQTVLNGTLVDFGAGSYRYGAVFAWDRPGRSLVGVDNLYDGTGRANHIQYYYGQGGPPVPSPALDAASIARYGEYWVTSEQQFFPSQEASDVSASSLQAMELFFRSTFKETLTVHPAPERSPSPFTDYYLGDGVRDFVSDNLRQPLPPSGTNNTWQRIYGIPIDIDDNGVETVRELLVGPVGAPPPVVPAGRSAPEINTQVSITTARQTNRQGGVGP